jgi:sugar phosphate isomerase/epimerase
MKPSICHYSYHRAWEEKGWNCLDLARTVKSLGVDAVDFHVRYLGEAATAAGRIRGALDRHDLELSGISLSNNLNQTNAAEFEAEIESTVQWIRLAAEVEAPVSRIFGGHVADRSDVQDLNAGFDRIIDGLGRLADEAKRYDVVLALENHGGLPCTSEEQIEVIQKIDSDHLRATVDIGNYMGCGKESASSCTVSAPYAAYVHVKDFVKIQSDETGWGWKIESAVLGEGVVDVPGCLRALRDAGYDGYLALEYEADTDEARGVSESIEYLKSVLAEM